jgi:hypothetical protein
MEKPFPPQYQPGDAIAISGIYRIVHETVRHHVPVIDVVCGKGGVFPKCAQCKPTYTLLHRYAELTDIFPRR